MSDRRIAVTEFAMDAIPRVKKDHLRDFAKTWIGSQRREPARADEMDALAIVVLIGGDRLALYPDPGDLLRVKELDR